MSEQNIYRLADLGLEPGSDRPQTELIQRALDLAGKTGGTVVFPRGSYVTGGLLIGSDTTVFLEKGARLLGSADPDDYPVFDVPEGLDIHTDMQMLPVYFGKGGHTPRPEYRRAVFSAYGCHNISIIGEGSDSVIDGRDCYDPEGEEQMRGPHGIFFSNCEHITLKNYTIQNSANFHHQIDTSTDVHASGLTVLGGHDGFHLHCCREVLIEDCDIRSGDDCIGAINMENVTLLRCRLNTSCQLFRIGGKHIHVLDCQMYGPGQYPYRRSIMTSPGVFAPPSTGCHEIISFMEYFGSTAYPLDGSYDILFRGCRIDRVRQLLEYHSTDNKMDGAHFCAGTPLRELVFEDCEITNLMSQCTTSSAPETPLTVKFRNFICTGTDGKPLDPFSEKCENLILEP